MKQKIYKYELYLFEHDKPYMFLTQEQGQKLSIALSSGGSQRFVMIGEDVINVSSIKRILKVPSKEFRELTESEKETQNIFDNFTNKKNLLTD